MRNLHMNYHARSDSKGLELYYNNLKDSLNEVYVELRKDFFSQDLKEEEVTEVRAPWDDFANKEIIRSRIKNLSLNERTFLTPPPKDIFFNLEEEANIRKAKLLLKEDEQLRRVRYRLVPSKISEENFWRNYFYRVDLILQENLPAKVKNSEGDLNSLGKVAVENFQTKHNSSQDEAQMHGSSFNNSNIEKDELDEELDRISVPDDSLNDDLLDDLNGF
ncbi:synapse-associated protein 1-like isoform X2 [Zophobas morio]|uniref:synapse-associated protein 1-like isoform X2 n=1 Tax=Zophobas morio TaxID=2755281 RepID=UPI0030837DAC